MQALESQHMAATQPGNCSLEMYEAGASCRRLNVTIPKSAVAAISDRLSSLTKSAATAFPVAKVNNADGTQPIDRQLYETSTAKVFLLPESCHPRAPTHGRWPEPTGLI